MLIDWFTVGAQAINFIILVWLLKRFSIIRSSTPSMRGRNGSPRSLRTPTRKRPKPKKDRDEFQRKNEEFDQQRAALLSKATEEAKSRTSEALGEARQAADALNAKRQEALRSDAHNLG